MTQTLDYKDFTPKETIFTKVVGTTFRTIPWGFISVGTWVAVQREPNNQHDPNAIRVLAYLGTENEKQLKLIWPTVVFNKGWIQLGYLKKELAANLAASLDVKQCMIKAHITEITRNPNGENAGINLELEVTHLDLRHLLPMNPFFKEPTNGPKP